MTTEKSKRKCPKCNMAHLEMRTPRPLWMKATLFWLPIKRFKCAYCARKTYVYGAEESHTTSGNKLQSA